MRASRLRRVGRGTVAVQYALTLLIVFVGKFEVIPNGCGRAPRGRRRGERAGLGRRTRRSDRGAAAVEAALVLTLVVFPIVFGILSYGYLLTFRQSVSQASAEAARAAAVKTVSGPLAQRQALQIAAAQSAVGEAVGTFNSSMKCGQAHLTCDITFHSCPNVSPSGCVRVDVSYPYRDYPLLPPVPGLGFTLPQTLHYSAVAGVN